MVMAVAFKTSLLTLSKTVFFRYCSYSITFVQLVMQGVLAHQHFFRSVQCEIKRFSTYFFFSYVYLHVIVVLILCTNVEVHL